uniref:WGS project CBMG000000000 data, contig CS5907-c000470 n=1 Tax=Fusarium acuminatum CS5907 TaxID=1318461 RepID=A0A096PF35_9HYPO|nr:unnamed protein product [Fusarium acuminatum CS5907]
MDSFRVSSKFQTNSVLANEGDRSCDMLLTSARQSCRVLPFPRNLNFVCRSDLTIELKDSLLRASSSGHRISLWGTSGSGKTQIALDFAYSRREDPTCSVFWIHATNRTTFLRDVRAIGQRLGLSDYSNEKELLRAVCEGIESEPQWLVVFDGADDLAALDDDTGLNYSQQRSAE